MGYSRDTEGHRFSVIPLKDTLIGLKVNFMFTTLAGYRTYICAAAGAAVVACFFLGWVDETAANMLLGLLGFGALASLRAAK